MALSGSSRHVRISSVHSTVILTQPSLQSLREMLSIALKDCLLKVNERGTNDSSNSKVYAGLAGVSYLNFHLSRALNPIGHDPQTNLRLRSHQQLAIALSSSRHSLTPPSSGSKVAFLDTSVGLATLILLYQLDHFGSFERSYNGTNDQSSPPFDERTVDSATNVISAATVAALQPIAANEFAEDGCELLYGRAGLLYTLLILDQALRRTDTAASGADGLPTRTLVLVKKVAGRSTLKKVVDDIIRRGMIGADDYRHDHRKALEEGEICPSLMWCWHGKRYLGGAHGVAGILQIILQAPDDIVSPHFQAIIQTVAYLLSLQDPSTGNWPSRAMSRHDLRRYRKGGTIDLVQWCHGAPGILPLLSTLIMLHVSQSSSLALPREILMAILDSMHRASGLVATNGLLLKGPGLCHGVAGNASALFTAADAFAYYHRHISSQTDQEDQKYTTIARECTAGGFHLLRSYIELDGTFAGNDGPMEQSTPHRQVTFRTPDRPWSLYEGYGGLCAVLGEALQRVDAVQAVDEPSISDRKFGGRARSALLGYCDLQLNI